MKQNHHKLLSLCALAVISLASSAFGQKAKPAIQKTQKSVIFAVLNDGKTLEPVAYVNKGKLEPAVNGSDDSGVIAAFAKTYYKPGTKYQMLFGSAAGGTVSVVSANNKAECAPNTANATATSSKTTLKGFVMSLATNGTIKNTASVRRRPTAAERTEVESLVKAEYARNNLTPKVLHSQNLTVLDVNNDGRPEFVGSYWIEIDKTTRGLLFFIAEKQASGKVTFNYSDYHAVDQQSVMSGALKDVDDGVLNEVLLEAYDYDGDGNAEIFTYQPSFEGAGFFAYKRSGDKWEKALEVANYHCGY
jgi:hypothetical protein